MIAAATGASILNDTLTDIVDKGHRVEISLDPVGNYQVRVFDQGGFELVGASDSESVTHAMIRLAMHLVNHPLP